MGTEVERSTPLLVIAGFESAFERVGAVLDLFDCRKLWLPEHFTGSFQVKRATCTLFLVEPDTRFSSELYSLFTAVEYQVMAPHRFLVQLEPCERKGSMPSVKTTTEVDIADLKTVLARVLHAGGSA